MKTILYIILFSIEFCYAQFIPHKASITVSKDSVLSSEEFTVTYSLTEVEGYVYIGLMEGYFEAIGKDRWEGKIKAGETKEVIFTVKLRESHKGGIKEKVPLVVGFSYRPFGEKILGDGQFEQISIIIEDFKELRHELNKGKDGNDSLNKSEGSLNINLNLQLNTVPNKTKTIRKNTNTLNLEYYGEINSSYNNISELHKIHNPTEEFEIFRSNYDKASEEKVSLTDITIITIQYYAASVSFRNPSNLQLPWQYYFMAVTN